VSYTYQRLYNNPPVFRDDQKICPTNEGGLPPSRIGKDITKVVAYWRQVFDSCGANINANTNGHRGNEAREKKSSKQGGHRTKTPKEELTNYWIHPDAKEPLANFTDQSKEAFMEALAKVKKQYGTMTLEKDDCYNAEAVDFVPQKKNTDGNGEKADDDSNSDDSEKEDNTL
jgi:hypothetical protein